MPAQKHNNKTPMGPHTPHSEVVMTELSFLIEITREICSANWIIVEISKQNIHYFSTVKMKDVTRLNPADPFHAFLADQKNIFSLNEAKSALLTRGSEIGKLDPDTKFIIGLPVEDSEGLVIGTMCIGGNHKIFSDQILHRLLNAFSLLIAQTSCSKPIHKHSNPKKYIDNSSQNKLPFNEKPTTCHLFMDRELKVIAFNRALSDFIQRTGRKILNHHRKVLDYVHPSNSLQFEDSCRTALQGTSVEYEVLLDYGKHNIHWYMTYDPAYDLQGQIIGVSFNASDITRLVIQDDRVVRQTRQLDEIAFVQSHELRKPVSSILGLIWIMKDDCSCTDDDLLKQLEKATNELDQKIRKIVGNIN